MVEGTLIDAGYGSFSVPKWQEGAAVVSRWFGLKVHAKSSVPTKAFRCSRCSFVELYAPPKAG